MARIPVEVVERLKTEISVQRLAEARGVVFKPHGSDLIGRCPFHDDKTPSLVVTPAKNLWHCLGACQAGPGGHLNFPHPWPGQTPPPGDGGTRDDYAV